MKKRVQKRGRSYRLLGVVTVLAILVSLLLGFLVSEDACLAAFFAGATAITFGAILSFGIESASGASGTRRQTSRRFPGKSPNGLDKTAKRRV